MDESFVSRYNSNWILTQGDKRMYSVAILENEKWSSEYLRDKILAYSDTIRHVDLFDTVDAFLKCERKVSYDIFFLDVELEKSEMNGFEIAKRIRRHNLDSVIIFVSSHEEYVCEAFEFGALRFLRKPIDEDKLWEALKKSTELLKERVQMFFYKVDRKEYRIPIKKILYLESQGRKVLIHTIDQKVFEFYGTLKGHKQALKNYYFEQCYKSYLINVEYIVQICGEEVYLQGEKRLPISRCYKEAFTKKYFEYAQNKSRGSQE